MTNLIFLKMFLGCKAASKVLFTGTITLGCKSYLDAQAKSCFCTAPNANDQKGSSSAHNSNNNNNNNNKQNEYNHKNNKKTKENGKKYGWKTGSEL